jgi:hypothetical protein
VDAIRRANASTNGNPASTRSFVASLRSTFIDVSPRRQVQAPPSIGGPIGNLGARTVQYRGGTCILVDELR